MDKAQAFQTTIKLYAFMKVTMDQASLNKYEDKVYALAAFIGEDDIQELVDYFINTDDMKMLGLIRWMIDDRQKIFKYASDYDAYLDNNNLNRSKWSESLIGMLYFIVRHLNTLNNWLDFKNQNSKDEVHQTPTRKGGRKSENFQDYIANRYKAQTDDIIKRLHDYLDSARGRSAAIVLIAAIKNGYITTPTMAACYNEFRPNIIDRHYFNRYLDRNQEPDLWQDKRVEEMQQKLKV